MKKYFQILMLIVATGMSAANATPIQSEEATTRSTQSFQSGMYLAKNGKLAINIQKPKADMTLLIRDSRNNIVHTQRIPVTTEKLGLRLDISQLQDGEYQVEMRSGRERVLKKIKLSTPENITERQLSLG